MLLAVDIGNTNIVFGFYYGAKLRKSLRLETKRNASVEYYKKFFVKNKIKQDSIKQIIVCSVVPQTKNNFEKFCKEHFKIKPFEVADNIDKLGIKIKLKNPKEVGADRVVNAIAYFKKYKKAGIIIDFGTATTFDVVDDKGNYLGGMISPGINLAIKAFSDAAAKLPTIKIAKPTKVIGNSTITAMQSGIYFGYLGLIEKSISEIAGEMKKFGIRTKPKVIATGGLARFFAECKTIDDIAENLTLDGLFIINERKLKNET